MNNSTLKLSPPTYYRKGWDIIMIIEDFLAKQDPNILASKQFQTASQNRLKQLIFVNIYAIMN